MACNLLRITANHEMHRSTASGVFKWRSHWRYSVISDVIRINELNLMPWWKFRKEPQYKTDRGIGAVYAVFAICWFGMWYTTPMMYGGHWHILFALSWAGLSALHIYRSIKNRHVTE